MRKAQRPASIALLAFAVLSLGCTAALSEADVAATAENEAALTRSGVSIQSASERAPNLQVTPAATATTEPAAEPTLEPTAEPTALPPTAVQAAAAPQEPAATPAPVVQPANYPAEAVAILNQFRTSRGLSTLSVDGALSAAAMSYAQYMGQANFFGHYGPNGSSPQSRIRAAGFGGLYKGEALSAGQVSPGAAINALLASPPHAAILLEPTSISVGIGYFYAPGSYYGHYWVVVTGNP